MRKVLMLALAAGSLSSASVAASGSGAVRKPSFAVRDSYIVILNQGVEADKAANDFARAHNGRVGYRWSDLMDGFTIQVPEVAAMAIARDPRVKSVEQNGQLFLAASQNTSVVPNGAQGTLWGLDRVDQRTPPPGDNSYQYCETGFGVKIYIVDTGVLKTHHEFHRSATDSTTRVENGRTFTTLYGDGVTLWDRWPAPGDPEDYGTNPCNVLQSSSNAGLGNGHHGTGVASIAAGRTTGTAKEATIVPVKVGTCGGDLFVTDVIAGLTWIKQEHDNNPSIPKIVNMSMFHWVPGTNPPVCPGDPPDHDPFGPDLTTQQLSALETAVRSLVNSGVTVIVSANNQNQDARNTSPARLGYGNSDPAIPSGGRVITVGGSMLSAGVDKRWISSNPTFSACAPRNFDAGSNYGPAVDLFAPAHEVVAASLQTNSTAGTWGYRDSSLGGSTGTSFAAPMVAGLAARYVQTNSGATPLSVWQYLQANATLNALSATSLNGSPNRLAYKVGYADCRVRP